MCRCFGYWLPAGVVHPGSPPGHGRAGVPKPVLGSAPMPTGTASADGLGGPCTRRGAAARGVCAGRARKIQTGTRGRALAVVTGLQR